MVLTNDYAPLSREVDGEMVGVIVDVLKEAFGQRMKLDTSFKGYPWARAQKRVEAKYADAFVTVPTNAIPTVANNPF